MLQYPEIDPVAISIGPLRVHWYGLMYLVGILLAWWFMRVRAARPESGWTPQMISDLIFYGALGVVVGGRLGYVLFYNFGALLADPISLLRVWEGGMSFHGGMLGVFVACWLYGRKTGKGFFGVTDFLAPAIPLGLGAGRLGNFINGELWGRVTDVPWGMVFPNPDAGPLPRHPSSLYQMFLEGVVLFTVLWLFSQRPRPTMAVSAMFLLGYGVFRFAVEFVRQPDDHIGYIAFGWLTMGQLLTLPMIAAGIVIMLLAYGRKMA